jgi:hypothetical protein
MSEPTRGAVDPAAIDPLGLGARWQDAEHTRADAGPAAVRRRCLNHADNIPARPPPRLGLLHGAPGLAAVERIAVTRTATSSRSGSRYSMDLIASFPGTAGSTTGTDLFRHGHSPLSARMYSDAHPLEATP